MNDKKIAEAFTLLLSEVPCCSCCGSDDGYIENVISAYEIARPKLSDEQKKRVHKDFLAPNHWKNREVLP